MACRESDLKMTELAEKSRVTVFGFKGGHLRLNVILPAGVSDDEADDVFQEVIDSDIYDVESIVELGDQWLDIGCHVGFFAMKAALHGAQHIHVVDADDRRSSVADANSVLAIAAHDVGRDDFYVIGESSASTMMISTIDDVISCKREAAFYTDQVQGIKIDIQGSEREILAEGGASFLAQEFNKLIMEWHYPDEIIQIEEHLEASGWTVKRRSPHDDVLLNTKTYIIYATSNLRSKS